MALLDELDENGVPIDYHFQKHLFRTQIEPSEPLKPAPPLPTPSNPMIADPAIIAQARALAASARTAKVSALPPIQPGFIATSFRE
ncbi:hypothetical protein PHLCEN_2v13480 [Hermanssonia centrifuga]|uniref:Uncharacterized protein n=1 Tax=Hermanssonia centrifuga TaxID=98765 RepID=A0A2R6NE79_9APHY|nr:hypothetical protein PHLCEN_2v13480 [Hermanssonia centrifuga]